jgi:peptidoglycan/LPS O-acetylase OafA/YrhL
MIPQMHNSEIQHNDMKPSSYERQKHSERLYYLDWLRVVAILGVFYAHNADIFDTLYWHVRQQGQQLTDWSVLGVFGGQWGMSLFFLLAGAGAWFTLSSRTSRQFIADRFKRLLIPFIFVSIVLSPIQAYVMSYYIASGYSLYHGNLLEFFNYFFQNIHIGWDLSWLAAYGYHLWFLAYLFIISMLALPLLLYLRRERGSQFISRLAAFCERPAGLFVFALPTALVQIILWAPFPGYQGWADVSIWLLIFVNGFILLADTRFEAAIRKQGKIFLPFCIVSVLMIVVSNYAGVFSNLIHAPSYSIGYVLFHLLLSIAGWSFMISLLYIGIRFLNIKNKAIQYASEAILPFYILHQPVIMITAFFILPWNLPSGVKFLIVSTVALIATLLLYELLIRRIKVLRMLFGLKTSKPRRTMHRHTHVPPLQSPPPQLLHS